MTTQNESNSGTTSVKSSRQYWRRTATVKPWWPWGVVPFVGLVVLFLFGALFMAPRIEAEVRGQVSERIDNAGMLATDVIGDGQGVTIEAVVPHDREIYVEALAKSTQCETWAGSLTCPTSVSVRFAEPEAAPALQSRRPHSFTIERTDDAVLLTGEVPDLEEHDRMLQLAGQHFDMIRNDLTISNDPAGANYGRAADRAITVASLLNSGTATWSGETLSVQGVAEASAVAQAREQFGAIGDESLRGEFSVRALYDRERCNSDFSDVLANASIRFRTGSAEIDAGNDELLARLAELAGHCPGNLTVAGHTDSRGDADMNESLSLARATAVRDALAALGVRSERMNAVGFGEEYPIADNATSAGRATNRRIAITVEEAN